MPYVIYNALYLSTTYSRYSAAEVRLDCGAELPREWRELGHATVTQASGPSCEASRVPDDLSRASTTTGKL